jgi:hypothetical protein
MRCFWGLGGNTICHRLYISIRPQNPHIYSRAVLRQKRRSALRSCFCLGTWCATGTSLVLVPSPCRYLYMTGTKAPWPALGFSLAPQTPGPLCALAAGGGARKTKPNQGIAVAWSWWVGVGDTAPL